MKLRIRQGIYILLAIAAFSLLIWVVTNSQSPESLMNPPEAAGDYKSIQNEIEKKVDEGIILKAPNEGEYTTAINFMDLNADNENDAVAFYRIKNDDTSSIYMSVLLKSGNRWQTGEPIKGRGNDVLEFSFGDLNYDSLPEIVVGWNMFDSKDNNTLSVYSLEDEKDNPQLKECYSMIYTKMFLADVCDEGRAEILLIKNTFNDETIPASAGVYELVDGALKAIDSTPLVASVSAYERFQMQQVGTTNVFFLDGVVHDENMITEILYWNGQNKRLVNATYNEEATRVITYRKGTVPSTDMNADSIIEIPFSEETYAEEYVNITEWKQFRFDKYISVAHGVCTDDLIFNFPDKWEGKVAVEQQGKLWTFYDISTYEREKLFDLIVTDISDWQSLGGKYDKLSIHYGTIYGVKLYDTDSALALSKAELEKLIIDLR